MVAVVPEPVTTATVSSVGFAVCHKAPNTKPSTPIKLKAEYISAKTEVDGKEDRKNDLYGVGADYQINKQARFYGIVAQQKRDWLTKDDKKTNIGLGMEYNF